MKPAVLLCDEIISALDLELVAEAENLAKEGMTLIGLGLRPLDPQ